jgi:Agrobacterium tumefaciens protein Atu4866
MTSDALRTFTALSAAVTMTAASATPTRTDHDDPAHHPYLGMWVTRDGHIRHELLPTGRYDEQRGDRRSAYQGRYWIKGSRIVYLDDTGFTADGEFREGAFFHGGYVFHRESGR